MKGLKALKSLSEHIEGNAPSTSSKLRRGNNKNDFKTNVPKNHDAKKAIFKSSMPNIPDADLGDCVFFSAHGFCKNRADCKFRHMNYDNRHGFCFDYEKSGGKTCRRGLACRFLHSFARLRPCAAFAKGSCSNNEKNCPSSHRMVKANTQPLNNKACYTPHKISQAQCVPATPEPAPSIPYTVGSGAVNHIGEKRRIPSKSQTRNLPETDAKELTSASHVVAPGFKKFITTMKEQSGSSERKLTNNNASSESKATEGVHSEAAEQTMTEDREEHPGNETKRLNEQRKFNKNLMTDMHVNHYTATETAKLETQEEVPKEGDLQLEEARNLAAIRKRAKASIEEARLRKLAMDSMHKVHTDKGMAAQVKDERKSGAIVNHKDECGTKPGLSATEGRDIDILADADPFEGILLDLQAERTVTASPPAGPLAVADPVLAETALPCTNQLKKRKLSISGDHEEVTKKLKVGTSPADKGSSKRKRTVSEETTQVGVKKCKVEPEPTTVDPDAPDFVDYVDYSGDDEY